MLNVVAIIQARMGSTRLQGKVLKDLCGDTVLGRVVTRTRRATLLNDVIVATTTRPADDAIVRECQRLRTRVFRGNEDDVLDRYYLAAIESKADIVVRITSDCPLVDPDVTNRTIRAFLDSAADYASNSLERTYPRGLDVEVVHFSALERAWREASHPSQREHVTPFLYQNPNRFKLESVKYQKNYSWYRWTLDVPEDLEFLRALYGRRADMVDLSWLDILQILQLEPQLTTINQHVQQRKVV